MATIIILRELSSRVIRRNITQNSRVAGVREIRRVLSSSSSESGGFIGFISNFFGKGIKATGILLFDVLKIGAFSFVALFQAIVQTTTFLYNFNWNITDAQIEQRFEIAKQIMAGQLGELFGNAVGYLACGVLPSAAILSFNEPLGVYLLKEVGEEALDEFCAELGATIKIGLRLAVQQFAYSTFKNARKAIKLATSPNNPAIRALGSAIYGERIQGLIDNWGEQNAKPWSFRIYVEDRINNIENPLAQEFIEEFYDSFKDSCVEAGYVLANSLDMWTIQQKQAQDEAQQDDNVIEIIPNRDAPDESLIFYGDRDQLQNQTLSTINLYNLVEGRDVGAWVGMPLMDNITKPAKEVAMKILLRGAPFPPYRNPDGSLSKRTQIEIPCVDRAKINWRDIKQAVGGVNGYLWGRFLFTCRLENDDFIKFYAASEAEGRLVLDRLLKFCKYELLMLNIREEKKEGARRRYESLYKEQTRVYPARVVIVNRPALLREDEGKATTKGYKDHRQVSFELYTNDKPQDFDTALAALFSPVI